MVYCCCGLSHGIFICPWCSLEQRKACPQESSSDICEMSMICVTRCPKKERSDEAGGTGSSKCTAVGVFLLRKFCRDLADLNKQATEATTHLCSVTSCLVFLPGLAKERSDRGSLTRLSTLVDML
eukprot:s1654_g7.t1